MFYISATTPCPLGIKTLTTIKACTLLCMIYTFKCFKAKRRTHCINTQRRIICAHMLFGWDTCCLFPDHFPLNHRKTMFTWNITLFISTNFPVIFINIHIYDMSAPEQEGLYPYKRHIIQQSPQNSWCMAHSLIFWVPYIKETKSSC